MRTPAAAFAQVAGPQRVSGLLPHLAPRVGALLCTPPRTGRPGRPWQPGACLQRRSWCADGTLCWSRLWALVSDRRVTEETACSSVLVALGHEEKTAVRHRVLLSAQWQWEHCSAVGGRVSLRTVLAWPWPPPRHLSSVSPRLCSVTALYQCLQSSWLRACAVYHSRAVGCLCSAGHSKSLCRSGPSRSVADS